MAVVLKINPGFDASYPWREIGTGSRPEPASGLDYYLAPADKGGEPAGRWAGRGLPTLGFAAGQVIDRSVFEPLYGEHLDPRDPAGKTRLGRAAQRFTLWDPAGLFGGTPRRFQSSGVPVVHDLFCGRLAPRPASCLAAEWCGHVDAAAALAGCSRAHCEDGAFVVPSGEPGDADPR